jgi:hypothetical protein
LPTNDLQQQESTMSHSAPVDVSNSVTPELRAEPRRETKSNSKGLTSLETIDNPSAQPANAAQHQSQIQNPKSQIEAPFLGSIVINPYECGAAVVLKTLEQESAWRARLAATADPPVGASA